MRLPNYVFEITTIRIQNTIAMLLWLKHSYFIHPGYLIIIIIIIIIISHSMGYLLIKAPDYTIEDIFSHPTSRCQLGPNTSLKIPRDSNWASTHLLLVSLQHQHPNLTFSRTIHPDTFPAGNWHNRQENPCNTHVISGLRQHGYAWVAAKGGY